MRIGVGEEAGKEGAGLHEEEVDETAVEEKFAIVDMGWQLVDIRRLRSIPGEMSFVLG